MNVKSTIAAAALAFVAAACATTDEESSLLTECEFSDGSKAPAWTCNFDETLNIAALSKVTWAVGRAKKMPAGPALQKNVATLGGQSQLLNQIAVRVENLLQQQVQGTNAQNAIEQFTQSFSEGILAGSRPYSRVIDPESKEMFVLVGITDEDFKKNVQANKQYQELKEAILAGGGSQEAARRIDQGLERISEAKKNIGLEGARKLRQEREKVATAQ